MSRFTFKWRGTCGVCGTDYEKETDTSGPPFHSEGKSYGCFCPTCRDNKLMAPGVVHFTTRMEDDYEYLGSEQENT